MEADIQKYRKILDITIGCALIIVAAGTCIVLADEAGLFLKLLYYDNSGNTEVMMVILGIIILPLIVILPILSFVISLALLFKAKRFRYAKVLPYIIGILFVIAAIPVMFSANPLLLFIFYSPIVMLSIYWFFILRRKFQIK